MEEIRIRVELLLYVKLYQTLNVTSIFRYIEEQSEQAGLYLHYDNAKETMQLFINEDSYNNREKYIGAIQYEGSNNFEKKELHIVSWRFKRSIIPNALKQELELIKSFRRDKNKGPAVNPEAESIAYKFEYLNQVAKETIAEIVNVLQKYT